MRELPVVPESWWPNGNSSGALLRAQYMSRPRALERIWQLTRSNSPISFVRETPHFDQVAQRLLRWQGAASTLGGMHRTALALLLAAAGGLSLVAQTTSSGGEQQVHADMNQLMRGILYPAANVVFSAQNDNPAEIKTAPDHDPNMSTNPLTSSYGGWIAVENAALALAESANLIAIEGRRCTTGVVAPTKDPGWQGFVRDLRAASMKAYAVAKAKDQEQMIQAADALNASCTGCHRRFRDRRPPAVRCTLPETK